MVFAKKLINSYCSELHMSGTIEVEDIQSMYRFIRDRKCDCGGKLHVIKQRKIGKKKEMVTAHCIDCKKPIGFVFNIQE